MGPDKARAARRGALAVVAAAVLYGTTGTAQVFAPAGASPLSVGAARLLLGGALLGVIGLVRRLRRTGLRLPAWSATTWWVLLGAGCVMAYQATFFAGTRTNGVAVATVAALGTSPLFAGLFEWLVFRRPPGLRWALATGAALVGLVLLAGVSPSAPLDPFGLAASLAAGASYAGYTIATKAVLARGWDATAAVCAMLGAGAVLAAAVLPLTATEWLARPTGIAVVLWLGVATVVVTYLLLGQGLRHLSAATATTLTLAEPATAALLGVIVLSEPLSGWQVAGILGIGGAVALTGTTPRR